jgi:subtilisin family serine protease
MPTGEIRSLIAEWRIVTVLVLSVPQETTPPAHQATMGRDRDARRRRRFMGAGQLAHRVGPRNDRPDAVVTCRVARGLCAALALGVAACGDDAKPDVTRPPGDAALETAKVDPSVLAALATKDSLSVIVLGRNQLLERVGGLEQFEREHAAWTRQSLRADVVSRLRAIAESEQAEILATIGPATRVRRLWIYDAVAGTLGREQIAALSQLSSVAYIYANVGERVVFPTGNARVSFVAPNATASGFEPGRVPVAWNIRWLGVDRVWAELRELGAGAVIASIDDGVNYAHADVRSHVWKNPGEILNNGRDDDGNGYVDDAYGYDFALMSPEVRATSTAAQHGTWTAGLMVADGTSGVAAGVAPRARLMVLRAAGHVAIAEALQYAVANGADVVNMSFTYRGEGNRRALWRMMSDHAVAAGLVLAGGAGNNQKIDAVPYQIGSPKDVPSMFVAGGIDTTLAVLPFSSLGPVEWGTVKFYGDYPLPGGLVKPDVVAFPGPGLTVLALADAGYLPASASVQGNSFSGPQAAGVAALVMSAVPTLPGWRARDVIERTARDIAPNGKDPRTGEGLVDAFAAVSAARALAR